MRSFPHCAKHKRHFGLIGLVWSKLDPGY